MELEEAQHSLQVDAREKDTLGRLYNQQMAVTCATSGCGVLKRVSILNSLLPVDQADVSRPAYARPSLALLLKGPFFKWGVFLYAPVGFHSAFTSPRAGRDGGWTRWHAANAGEARPLPAPGLAGSCVILLGLLGSYHSSICYSPITRIYMEADGRHSFLGYDGQAYWCSFHVRHGQCGWSAADSGPVYMHQGRPQRYLKRKRPFGLLVLGQALPILT